MDPELNQSDHCKNSSYVCLERSGSGKVDVIIYTCATVIILLTVFGNLLVIISVCHFKQLHTPTNLLILSLAASDFLVGFFVMPFHSVLLIESCWLFGFHLCNFFSTVSVQVTTLSVHNVTLIAVDRYFALSNPFLYSKAVSLNVMIFVVSLFWITSIFYSFAILYTGGLFHERIQCSGECFINIAGEWPIVDLILVLVLPCSVIIVLYVRVFAIVRRHANAIRRAKKQQITENTKYTTDSLTSEIKAAKALTILVLVFLVCLVPFYLYMLIAGSISITLLYKVANNIATLFYLNSSLNPIIYAFSYSWFKKSIKLILSCQIFNTDSSLMNVHLN
ncbi:trace amine-associated receptor 13c-like [Chanos chanos]|uniref:Trace amine-associated receptor 13c-like n=1 Tax=Chanos chanos TaxID=29144 RepID=A0A6J2W2C0_CHACN|nr:trace amine-associated receptor 13c-like [Chanos chanos]